MDADITVLPFKRKSRYGNTMAWYPETNFVIFDVEELVRNFPGRESIPISGSLMLHHEIPHFGNRGTGTVINMFRYARESLDIIEGADKIGGKVARNALLTREVVSNRLWLSTNPILEAEAVCELDKQCRFLTNMIDEEVSETALRFSSRKTPGEFIEGMRQFFLPLYDHLKRILLAQSDVRSLYNELSRFATELDTMYLPDVLCTFALDIPYPLDPNKLTWGVPSAQDPAYRLSVTLDLLSQLAKNGILNTVKPIADFASKAGPGYRIRNAEKAHSKTLASNQLVGWLEEMTGFRRGSYPESGRYLAFEAIMNDPSSTYFSSRIPKSIGRGSEDYDRAYARLERDEGIILEMFHEFASKMPLHHPDSRMHFFVHGLLTQFICLGWKQQDEITFLANPLTDANLRNFWREHWCLSYLKECILSDLDMYQLITLWPKFDTDDFLKFKRMGETISSAQADQPLEQAYVETTPD